MYFFGMHDLLLFFIFNYVFCFVLFCFVLFFVVVVVVVVFLMDVLLQNLVKHFNLYQLAGRCLQRAVGGVEFEI